MELTISLENEEKTIRNKGNSLISPVDDYIVFDLETTGTNIKECEIIEIAAIKYINNIEVDRFETLVRPLYSIDETIAELTGITNEMVENAPTIDDVIYDFFDFIGDNVLIGHNINAYDLNIIYDLYKEYFYKDLTNDFIDTLLWAKRGLSLEHNRLVDVADYYKIEVKNAHRALADCITNSIVYNKMRANFKFPLKNKKKANKTRQVNYRNDTVQLQILNGILTGITFDGILTEQEILSLKSWLDENKNLSGQYPYNNVIKIVDDIIKNEKVEKSVLDDTLIKLKQIINPVSSCDKLLELIDVRNKNICLSGEFNIGSRKDVEAILQNIGAVIQKNVTSKTDYLIVGNLNSPNWKCGTYGNKIKHARELQEKGKEIKIYNETEFFEKLK